MKNNRENIDEEDHYMRIKRTKNRLRTRIKHNLELCPEDQLLYRLFRKQLEEEEYESSKGN